MEEEKVHLHHITKFHASFWNVSTGEAASKKHGSSYEARKSNGSRQGLMFKMCCLTLCPRTGGMCLDSQNMQNPFISL